MKAELICYHTPSLSSFVKKDIAILEKHFTVKVFIFKASPKWKIFLELVKQKLFILRNLFNCQYHVVQFGGYHSFLPALLGKIFNQKCIIVAGGTDCVGFPEIGYGNFHKPLLGQATCLSYRLATLILPVDESLENTENTYSEEHSKYQGIKHFCKNLKTPIQTIYNGYNEGEWQSNSNKTANSFISVAAGLEEKRRYILKGFDLIIELAHKLPECQFTFVGTSKLPDGVIIPKNVMLIDFASKDELVDLFSKHKYYLQLSISEGFPNAICEAMLCGCIPIGSNVAALPKIIGNSGYVLKKRNLDILLEMVNQALHEKEEKEDPRSRIIENFPLAARERKLIEALELKLN